ncbi:MAG: hypothetical protein FJ095_08030 [Deltaproteobacteria bacterium]|nr:hypothetical protein [Deltaproteobacteria bacterium]
MSTPDDLGAAAQRVFDRDEVEGVLRGTFYNSAAAPGGGEKAKDEKPTHYKVICISMYTDSLERLDDMVKELKRRGYTKANRSALLRHALELVDLDAVPRGL